MSKLVLNDYLSSLQRQISVSVDKIKDKDTFAPKEDNTEAKSYDYRHALSGRAYSLLDSDVSYQMFALKDKQGMDSSYAAQSYNFAAHVDRPSTVLLDFMFEGNREFDFKV